jgi:hypothetical protein
VRRSSPSTISVVDVKLRVRVARARGLEPVHHGVPAQNVHEIVVREGLVNVVPVHVASAKLGGGFGDVVEDDLRQRGGVALGVLRGFHVRVVPGGPHQVVVANLQPVLTQPIDNRNRGRA